MTGGAAQFAVFLEEELIPYIESKYPADPSRRCFAGYSLGGLLGVHLLTANPQLFQNYLLGSPSLWYNHYYLGPELEKMPPDRLRAIKRVYLSVGEEESWEMLKGFDILRSALREKGFTDSRAKMEIIISRRAWFRMWNGVSVPWTIALSPTMRCNYKCAGCYSRGRREDQELAPDKIDRLFGEAQGMGVAAVVLTGGEPLLCEGILSIIVRYRRLLFFLITNGSLVTEILARQFRSD